MAFIDTVEKGIEKLEQERSRLQGKQYDMHFCDCEFCEKNGSEVELTKILNRINEVEEEIQRLKRYKKEHANV